MHLCEDPYTKHGHYRSNTAQKLKFSIKDFFSKCDQIRSWSHALKKLLMENFIFCAALKNSKVRGLTRTSVNIQNGYLCNKS